MGINVGVIIRDGRDIYGDEVNVAVGVSGAPGGEKNEACSKAGIDKVADQLK